MITVERGVLMNSKTALDALGKVYIPVGKERYWYIKTLDKVKKALKREEKLSGAQSNTLINELGKMQADGPYKGRKAVMPDDVEAHDAYQKAMEEFMSVEVSVDVNPLTLQQLQDAQVTLQANDHVALLWLIHED
jgi:hypothetical protein